MFHQSWRHYNQYLKGIHEKAIVFIVNTSASLEIN